MLYVSDNEEFLLRNGGDKTKNILKRCDDQVARSTPLVRNKYKRKYTDAFENQQPPMNNDGDEGKTSSRGDGDESNVRSS